MFDAKKQVVPRRSRQLGLDVDKSATYSLPITCFVGEHVDGSPPETLVDLSGATATFVLAPCGSETPITHNSATSTTVTLDVATSVITIKFTAQELADYTWSRADYRLEIAHSNGDVTPLIHGRIRLLPR